MLNYGWIIPRIPAVSFVLILFFGKRMPRKGSEIGILAVGASFVLSCVAVYQWIDRVDDATGGTRAASARSAAACFGAEGGHGEAVVTPVVHHVTWWQNGGIEFGVGIRMDGLAVMMLLRRHPDLAARARLLHRVHARRHPLHALLRDAQPVHRGDAHARRRRQHAADARRLGGVGLCSFALIGHWWEESANSAAALKAFLTTRTGDIGLMIGIIILFFAVGQLRHRRDQRLRAAAPAPTTPLLLAGAVCLFIGIIGKSGQFPLHTWLPDAMAGPTPVSALIHAATMVVAGVYLGARLYPVFFNGFSIARRRRNFMVLIGGITIIIGAVLAFVQDDIKKVLAYSTISQLGYMVMALGVGAWTAAVFHLFTHAFFKACSSSAPGR